MLVLARTLGEKIQIGDDVTVTVVGIQHGKIRLGIDAPRNLPVNRGELVGKPRDEGVVAHNEMKQSGARLSHRRLARG
jgi:carbon storage regulator